MDLSLCQILRLTAQAANAAGSPKPVVLHHSFATLLLEHDVYVCVTISVLWSHQTHHDRRYHQS